MSKYTPGPWTAEYRAKVGEWWIGMSPKEGSTTCGVKVSVFGPDEASANARLIAAAPELLEALKTVVLESLCGHVRDCREKCVCGYSLAKYAIAKAEGKE